MLRIGVLLGIGLLLSACSTAVTHHQPLPTDLSGNLRVTEVEVTPSTVATPNVDERLKYYIGAELAKRKQGDTPLKLVMQVTDFQVKSGGARFFAGAIVGSNTMTVAVEVKDASGQTVSKFDVARKSNPGGYGAFYDQEAATIQAAAEGVVNALYGTKGGASTDP